MNVNELIALYPRLYHMAEAGTWGSIRARGLLSTTAALDQFGLQGAAREALEQEHRSEKVSIGPVGQQIVLRDQKPMPPDRIQDALIDGTTAQQWYQFLNGMVFMWAEQERLFKLLNARYYKNLEHDVLTIDTAAVMDRHAARVWLCPMNSGNTLPMPHPRGMSTFKRIADYPMRPNSARPVKNVVEVVVDYSIPDIAECVLHVRRIKGQEILAELPL